MSFRRQRLDLEVQSRMSSKRQRFDLKIFSQLPQELIFEILPWLPTKSLFKMKAVCRAWRHTIQTSSFMENHINRTFHYNNQRQDRVLFNLFWPLSFHSDNPPFREYPMLNPRFRDGLIYVIGTCNGLVCLVHQTHSEERIAVWNPTIRRFVNLPGPSKCNMEMELQTKKSYNFGYDVRTYDHKVLRLVSSTNSCEIQIWSLDTNIWRSLSADVIPADFRPGFQTSKGETQTLVHGALHWVQSGHEECFIRSFDMSTELFGEIKLPEALRREEICQISRYKNYLAIFERYDDDRQQQFDMWVMKEYGVMQSWVKLLSVPTPTTRIKPNGFLNTGEVLLRYYPAVVKMVDPKNSRVRPFEIKDRKYFFFDYFVESPFLLNKADAICYSKKGKVLRDRKNREDRMFLRLIEFLNG